MRDKYTECSVFWVPVTNIESFQQAYLEIGRQLQIPDLEEEKSDVRKLVQHHMSQESTGQWLLIFDNADDIDMWFKNIGTKTESSCLIDYVPRSNKGSIVFTTRSQKVAVQLAHQNVIKVAEMDRDDATEVLRNALINQMIINDQETVLEPLLDRLTFLPLAIVQAAAYINANSITLSEYLSLFEDHEQNVIEILSEDFKGEGRYRDTVNPVAATWLISFEQIRRCDSLAADYLSFMSCIDPKAIPQSLLPPAPSRKKMVDAIGTLSAYSFIEKRPADQSLDLHRLVHLATRNWLRQQDSLVDWTVKAIARLVDVLPNDADQNRTMWRTYLPHAQYVYTSDLFQEDLEESLLLMLKLGQCLFSDGRWNEAEMPFMQVMEERKRVLGQEHPSTLTSMNNLAEVLGSQGKYEEAERMQRQVLQLKEKVLGQEHPSTLASMNNLSFLLGRQGKHEEAKTIFHYK
jgi:tetratricopeptide (TPR) repeat protein